MALTDGLVSYWRLEEASGSRADEVGGHTLTDNNTVTSATGKQGTAAQFTRANSEYLSVADHADLSPGDTDFTFQAWVYLDSKPAGSQMRIIDKYQTGAKEYALLYYQSGDRFEWIVSADGSSDSQYKDADTFGAPSLGVWYLIHAWHDSINNQIGIAVNAGTADTASHSGGVYNSTTSFEIGRNLNGGSSRFCWDGRIDEVALWSRVLTGAERTQLYNSGAGLAYEDLAGGTPTTVTPSPLAVTATVPTHAVAVGCTVAPAAMAVSVTVPTHSVTAGCEVVLSPLAVSVAVPTHVVENDPAMDPSNVVLTPLAVTATVPTHAVAVGCEVALSPLAVSATVPEMTVGSTLAVLLSPLTAAATAPTHAVAAGCEVALSPLAATATVPTHAAAVGWEVLLPALAVAVAAPTLAVTTTDQHPPIVLDDLEFPRTQSDALESACV